MGKMKTVVSEIGDKVPKAAGMLTAASIILPMAKDFAESYFANRNEKAKRLIIVPTLYDRNFPLDLASAKKMLEDGGFKVTATKVAMNEASPKYRNCFNDQVVGSKPKQNKKVEVGSPVILKYITQDVIDRSQKIFEEEERNKEEESKRKAIKKEEQKVRVKEQAVKIGNRVKQIIPKH